MSEEALIEGIKRGDLQAVKDFEQAGGNFNALMRVNPGESEEVLITPLMWATCLGRTAICQYLLILDEVDPNVRDREGCTAFYHLCSYPEYHTVGNFIFNERLVNAFTSNKRVDFNIKSLYDPETKTGGRLALVYLHKHIFGEDILRQMIMSRKSIQLDDDDFITSDGTVKTFVQWHVDHMPGSFTRLLVQFSTDPDYTREMCRSRWKLQHRSQPSLAVICSGTFGNVQEPLN